MAWEDVNLFVYGHQKQGCSLTQMGSRNVVSKEFQSFIIGHSIPPSELANYFFDVIDDSTKAVVLDHAQNGVVMAIKEG